jgi:hypothetical protein
MFNDLNNCLLHWRFTLIRLIQQMLPAKRSTGHVLSPLESMVLGSTSYITGLTADNNAFTNYYIGHSLTCLSGTKLPASTQMCWFWFYSDLIEFLSFLNCFFPLFSLRFLWSRAYYKFCNFFQKDLFCRLSCTNLETNIFHFVAQNFVRAELRFWTFNLHILWFDEKFLTQRLF